VVELRADDRPVVELLGISRSYGTDPPFVALDDVNLRVLDGEWIAIVGPSGSGKSTLLNVLGCLDLASEGTYLLDGIDVGQLSDRQRAGLRARSIGFVFQAFHLLAHRNIVENVMLAEVYRRQTRTGRRERAEEVLGRVGLSHRLDYRPTRLSGGERQRAAIARALMSTPRVLLCDEPTGNLDTTTTKRILELLDELNRSGLTVIMITHDHDVATRAGRQVRIVDGTLREVS
jgi:ABC-type lipoprotein export system ATPase subunit